MEKRISIEIDNKILNLLVDYSILRYTQLLQKSNLNSYTLGRHLHTLHLKGYIRSMAFKKFDYGKAYCITRSGLYYLFNIKDKACAKSEEQ